MLTHLKVDNFRSLKDFSIEIRPGINVLVGPNGAGKTNIIKWFEFLSLLISNNLREAVGKIGGANVVFRRGQYGSFEKDLTFSFSGNTRLRRYSHAERKIRVDGWIYYTFEANISFIDTEIFFSYQTLKVWFRRSESSRTKSRKATIEIFWKKEPGINDSSVSFAFNKPVFNDHHLDEAVSEVEREVEWLHNLIQARKSAFYDSLILNEIHYYLSLLNSVVVDLQYGRAYNIIPSAVRSVQDISASSGVNFDGSGVAATIYHMRTPVNVHEMNFLGPKNTNQSKDGHAKFLDVLSYFRISNPNIDDVNVTIDTFRNEFIGTVSFEYENGIQNVPLTQLSDGTIKWLALVTAIATEESAFFIEEPENFLHPKLQESAVSIIRNQTESHSSAKFAFITTHSETLLNTLTPDEIILVSMEDGNTNINRLENPKMISDVIARSGFGLGYFYVSGGF